MGSTYGIEQNKQSAPSLSVVKQTAFSSARETFDQVDKLTSRIESIVNHLAGVPMSETCGQAKLDPPPARGLFDEMNRGAIEAQDAVQRAHSALDRLTREY